MIIVAAFIAISFSNIVLRRCSISQWTGDRSTGFNSVAKIKSNAPRNWID